MVKSLKRLEDMQCGEFISTDCIYFGKFRCYIIIYPSGTDKNLNKGNINVFMYVDQLHGFHYDIISKHENDLYIKKCKRYIKQ